MKEHSAIGPMILNLKILNLKKKKSVRPGILVNVVLERQSLLDAFICSVIFYVIFISFLI